MVGLLLLVYWCLDRPSWLNVYEHELHYLKVGLSMYVGIGSTYVRGKRERTGLSLKDRSTGSRLLMKRTNKILNIPVFLQVTISPNRSPLF